MAATIRQHAWKISKWLGALFLVLFIFRILYGYYTVDADRVDDYQNYFSNVDNLKRNYASEKFQSPSGSGQARIDNSQKYEKTATVKSQTTQFEKEELAIRNTVKQFQAVIQYEKNEGNKGHRELHLVIGVTPVLFDSLYVATQKVGTVTAMAIAKVDKTNEYRKLNAKRESLDKTLRSLNELKSRNGQISDYVSLHDKILDIETQLQELGVELGDFDSENEFCTVRFSLYEGGAKKQISFFHRIKVALEWTIPFYAGLVVSLAAICIVSFLLILIIAKLKTMWPDTGK